MPIVKHKLEHIAWRGKTIEVWRDGRSASGRWVARMWAFGGVYRAERPTKGAAVKALKERMEPHFNSRLWRGPEDGDHGSTRATRTRTRSTRTR